MTDIRPKSYQEILEEIWNDTIYLRVGRIVSNLAPDYNISFEKLEELLKMDQISVPYLCRKFNLSMEGGKRLYDKIQNLKQQNSHYQTL